MHTLSHAVLYLADDTGIIPVTAVFRRVKVITDQVLFANLELGKKAAHGWSNKGGAILNSRDVRFYKKIED